MTERRYTAGIRALTGIGIVAVAGAVVLLVARDEPGGSVRLVILTVVGFGCLAGAGALRRGRRGARR